MGRASMSQEDTQPAAQIDSFPGESTCGASQPGWGATCIDLSVVFGLIAAVALSALHAPSTTYTYAQLQQIGVTIGTIAPREAEVTGTWRAWLAPRDQRDLPATKPPLYAWLCAPGLMLTGIHNDFMFRLPTTAAALVTGALVYLLGRRWYGRRAALLAGMLWATTLHMSKMMCIARTDMLLAMWITVGVFCADRLALHRLQRGRSIGWVVGLWAAMVLAAITKGWGLVNLSVVGCTVALAAALDWGFGELRTVKGWPRKAALAVRLIGRRWWRAVRAVRLGWGLAAMVLLVTPVLVGIFLADAEEFRGVLGREFVSRITGGGANPPHARSTGPVENLFYYTLPASVFALGAILLVLRRQRLTLANPVALPLCWIVATVIPFSLAHGFRPDYLLPCYAAVALMGGWALDEVARLGRHSNWGVRWLRHVFAAVPIVIGLGLILLPLGYVFHRTLPEVIRDGLALPAIVQRETWWIAAACVVVGVLAVAGAVWASLKWRVRTLGSIAAVAMLGVIFLHTHFISRHARTADGERMLRFSQQAQPIVGGDEFAVFRAGKLAAEVYLGRFGEFIDAREDFGAALDASSARWLITCDRGLVEAGAAMADPGGQYSFVGRAKQPDQDNARKQRFAFRTLPGSLGKVHLSSEPIVSQGWGRMYLIEVQRPFVLAGPPFETPHISGKRDEEW